MSVEIQTVEFREFPAQDTVLSDDEEEEPPFTVHGVALGAEDVTIGQSGVKKLWPEAELRAAANTLTGKSLVEDHDNGSRGVVGEVTEAGFKEGVGVIYEAELFDEELAEKIDNGLLEVSIRGHHIDVEEMEEDPDTGAKIVEGIRFDNLSIVPSGAAPSNTIEMGEHEELSFAELSTYIEELQELEAGDTVQWDEHRGIILSPVEDDADEVEVDLYEKDDEGTWRPIGETVNVSLDSLSSWDIDLDDLGEMEEEMGALDQVLGETLKLVTRFEKDEGGANAPISQFVEWADDPNVDRAVEMYVEEEGSRDDPIEEFKEWVDTKIQQAEENRVEGEEERITSEKELREQSPERFSKENDEEAAQHPMERPRTVDDEGDEPNVHDRGPAAIALDLINKYLETSGRHERDTVDDMLGWLVGAPDEIPLETVGDFRTAANSFLTQTPGTDSFDALRVEQFRDWLLMVQRGESPRDMNGERSASMSGEELQEVEVHTPSFSGTTEAAWNKPALEDFGEDPDLGEVAEHFIVSTTGFPPENYGDLALPVVEPNGELNINALRNAKARAGQVDGLSGDKLDRAVDVVNTLANEEFDADFEENASPEGDTLGSVRVLTGYDSRQLDKSEESEVDSIKTVTDTIMTDEEDIQERLAELEEPVAVEQSDLDELEEKADRFNEMAETLESLKERTDVLDDVDREQVEELAESDDPVVVESTEHEALQDEAEQVAGVYASSLSDAVEVFDAEELTDKFSIEELREKFEEHIGDPEEELASTDAEPRSGDVDEEELEEKAEEESEETEELSDEEEEAEEIRAELREKILGDD